MLFLTLKSIKFKNFSNIKVYHKDDTERLNVIALTHVHQEIVPNIKR